MKYFSISEFINSDTARKNHIDNTPSLQVRRNIEETVNNLLDDLRESWGAYCKTKGYGNPAIIVSSGYRCPALNKKVGGASNSSHLTGFAADLIPKNGKTKAFISFCSEWVKGRKFDQCIDEYGCWCHIGYKHNDGRQRGQIFSIR